MLPFHQWVQKPLRQMQMYNVTYHPEKEYDIVETAKTKALSTPMALVLVVFIFIK